MLPRTLRALDWDAVCEALSRHARTRRGARVALDAPLAAHAADARERYAEVAEALDAQRLNDEVPIAGVEDIADPVDAASRGAVLEPEDLRRVGMCLRALATLREWASKRVDRFPRFERLAAPISMDPALVALLEAAFDATGSLSDRMWPELGQLRRRIASLRDRIQDTLEEVLRSEEWAGVLQDRFVSEREGRYVVPVKIGSRRGLGIVHDTSHSGETAFVEPGAVVELHNELRQCESELKRVERRILQELSGEVGRRGGPILSALDAATDIDLVCARAALGRTLRGSIPSVGDEGVLVLKNARHPLLVLRGGDVVANDLALTPKTPGLVLTGPNAGGKTVALKTIGLAALLARAAIPVPADEDGRVDLFDPIVADVGDLQSVQGGLSTFSAHVGALRAALEGARPGALVLLDEVAVGTDPAQGAALARAVLEAVITAGARVVATTHYPELKTLASVDPRFLVAAAQYEEGRPTYRLEMGAPGPSYALQMARSLGVPESVVTRARALLDDAVRELADRLERLNEERAALRSQVRQLEAREAEIVERERKQREAEQKLEREGRRSMEAETAAFRDRLRAREEDVRGMVATLQAGGDLRVAGQTLAAVRAALDEAREPVAAPAPPAKVKPGDRVRVRSIGQIGRALTVGDQVEVEVGRLRMRVARTDLEILPAQKVRARAEAVVMVVESEPARVRTSWNTCDMRGMRAEEAIEAAERFLSDLALGPERVAFLLHGHGTGALKQAIRQWAPGYSGARSWRAADPDEGGDAYTIVELR